MHFTFIIKLSIPAFNELIDVIICFVIIVVVGLNIEKYPLTFFIVWIC